MSYSQSGEEAAIVQACRDARPHFLDIGAYHPTKLSNTRQLVLNGWSGIMIEPSPAAMLSLLEVYGSEDRITLIQAAIGAEAGLQKFHVSTEAVSTANEGVHTLWAESGQYIGKMFVPFLTLAELFNQFGAGYGFINIDAEGSSIAIAHELLKLTRETQCICVEYDSPDNRGLLTAMTEAGYALRYSSAENGVFQKMTWEEMHP